MSNSILEQALLFDVVALLICVTLLVRFGRLSALHPAVTYFAFHVYVVTLRLSAVLGGADTLRNLRGYFTYSELARAALASDLALIAMTVAWLWVAWRESKRAAMPVSLPESSLQLNPRYIWYVIAVALPIGLFGLANFGYAAAATQNQLDLGVWGSSSYLIVTVTWPLLVFEMLFFFYGLKPWVILPTLAFLILMVPNAARYAVVVPVIFLCFAYLSRARKQWFPLWMLVIIGGVLVVWFPLKQIAAGIRQGDEVDSIVTDAFAYSQDALETSTGDTVFLDQAATIMTLVDWRGDFFYGTTWLPFLTAPIPRQIWPDKPRLNEYMWEISTPDRPVAESGMVSTLAGDAYVNFGWVGVIVVPFLLAYAYGRGFFAAMRANHLSVKRFAYLVFACNLIQVFRDGIMSIFTFTLIASIPMMMVIYIHLYRRWQEHRKQPTRHLPWLSSEHAFPRGSR